jgi:hypothetical protein
MLRASVRRHSLTAGRTRSFSRLRPKGENTRICRGTTAHLPRLGMALAIVVGTGAGALLAIGGVAPAPAGAATAVTPTLYVSNYSGNTITSYPLSASGNASPTMTNSSSSLSNPLEEAFDA